MPRLQIIGPNLAIGFLSIVLENTYVIPCAHCSTNRLTPRNVGVILKRTDRHKPASTSRRSGCESVVFEI